MESEVQGYFGDLPYLNPVVSNAFFEACNELKLHKLPLEPLKLSELNLLSPDLFPSLATHSSKTNSKKAENALLFPRWHSSLQLSATDSSRISPIKIVQCKAPSLHSTTELEKNESLIPLSFHGISRLFTRLFLFLHPDSADTTNIATFEVVDIVSLDMPFATRDFALSMLLHGWICMLRSFARLDANTAENSKPKVDEPTLTLSVSELGLLSGVDQISLFISSAFGARTEVQKDTPASGDFTEGGRSSEIEVTTEDTIPEWRTQVCDSVISLHEEFFEEIDEAEGATFSRPTILMVVPSNAIIRASLKKSLLDCYTSDPITVLDEAEISKKGFPHSTVVLMCSCKWVVDQLTCNAESSVLRKMKVRAVVHAGFVDLSVSLEKEVEFIASALRVPFPNSEVKCFCCPTLPTGITGSAERTDFSLDEIAEGVYIILLIFARFQTSNNHSTNQPVCDFDQKTFFSKSAWSFFIRLVQCMTLAGIVTSEVTTNGRRLELTVLGRVMAAQTRIESPGFTFGRQMLSPMDVKAILWAHLLRQPAHVPKSIITAQYVIDSWVPSVFDRFCRRNNIHFTSDPTVERRGLTRQLSSYGFQELSELNRVHFLLSAPGGSRSSLPGRAGLAHSSRCRGWYAAAPLYGTHAEAVGGPVDTFESPPSRMFCEMKALLPNNKYLHIQCPLDVSYPLIVTHCTLHISLFNNCVFISRGEAPVSLPLTLLQNETMKSILAEETRLQDSVTKWIDDIFVDLPLVKNNSELLAPAALKGKELIGLCERSTFSRKRQRQQVEEEEAAAAAKEDPNKFTGVVPRTDAEMKAIDGFLQLATMGFEAARKALAGKPGFGFLDPAHVLHPYLLFRLREIQKGN